MNAWAPLPNSRGTHLVRMGGFALWLALILAGHPQEGEAQGISALIERLDRIEGRMAQVERGTRDTDAVASPAGPPADSLAASVRRFESELGRLRDETLRLRGEVEARSHAPVLDSLVLVVEGLAAGVEALLQAREETSPGPPLATPPVQAAPPLSTQAPTQVAIGGQVRPRYEARSMRSDGVRVSGDGSTSMRVRATIRAALEGFGNVMIQLQDVRTWGEEEDTLGDFSAGQFDLHQGYVEIPDLAGQQASLRLGRQEMGLGEQRLVGSVDWTQQGRSFDGVRLSAGGGDAGGDVFYMVTSDRSVVGRETSAAFMGAHTTLAGVGGGVLELFWFHDRARGARESAESTLGGSFDLRRGLLAVRVEGAYQLGTRDGDEVLAHLLAVRVGARIPENRGSVTFMYDLVSGGGAEDGRTRAFSTLYATNHRFYGYADLFLNLPRHTGGHGLQDLAARFSAPPFRGVSLDVDLHHFRAAGGEGLSSRHFADELDLTLAHRLGPQLTLNGGLSYVRGGSGFEEIGRFPGSQIFSFLMLNAAF